MKTFILGLILIIVLSSAIAQIFDWINSAFIHSDYKTLLLVGCMCFLVNLFNIGSSLKVNEWIKSIDNFIKNKMQE